MPSPAASVATRIWIAAIPELLLGVEARARVRRGAGLHAAVDDSRPEAPLACESRPSGEVIERVLEFGEDEQALSGWSKKPCSWRSCLEARQLGLRSGVLDLPWPGRPTASARAISCATLRAIPGERDRFEHLLQALTLASLPSPRVPRGRAASGGAARGEFLGPLQAFLEPAGPIFQRAAHGVAYWRPGGAGRGPSGNRPRGREGRRPGRRPCALWSFTKRVTSR